MSFLEQLFHGKRKRVERFMTQWVNQVTLDRVRHDADRNRRGQGRVPTTAAVHIVPILADGSLDEDGAFSAATRDVNLGGFSFTHRRRHALGHPLLVTVTLGDGVHRFRGVVRHCTDIGRGIFLTGCELVEELDGRPLASPPEGEG